MADNARAAEWETIRPEDDGRLFYQKKSWQKMIIMASGPTMNLLLAFDRCWGSPATYGVYRSQMTINRVQECIVAVNATDRSCLGKPPTPAVLSGIQAGDRVVAFNGVPVQDWDDVSTLIRANLDRPAQLSVERAGARVELPPVNTVITGVPDRHDPASGSLPASSASNRSSGSGADRSPSWATCGP